MRLTKINKTILFAIGVAGLVSVAIMAPSAVQLFYKLHKRNVSKKYEYNLKYKTKLIFEKLNKLGLARIIIKSGVEHIELTDKGRKLVERIKAGEVGIKKPLRWDEKWRVIIFDIREKRRKTRDQFRLQLKNLDFVQIQRSVWVYPYPCEEVIKLFKSDLMVGKDILYMEVDKIENDFWLRKKFKLL